MSDEFARRTEYLYDSKNKKLVLFVAPDFYPRTFVKRLKDDPWLFLWRSIFGEFLKKKLCEKSGICISAYSNHSPPSQWLDFLFWEKQIVGCYVPTMFPLRKSHLISQKKRWPFRCKKNGVKKRFPKNTLFWMFKKKATSNPSPFWLPPHHTHQGFWEAYKLQK